MSAEIVKKHELEILRYGRDGVKPKLDALNEAFARMQYEGMNFRTGAAFVKAGTAYALAVKKLLKMVGEHPEDFEAGFDLEALNKYIDDHL
jgi:hypothetical protein